MTPEEYLTPSLLAAAYSEAAFPMTMEDGSIGWFRPRQRAVFPLQGVHVSRSLARLLKSVKVVEAPARSGWEVTFDRAFTEVMTGCLREPGENWISPHFIQVYSECHREGWAHSCEVWLDGELSGGLYGLALGTAFCAESMFHRQTNGSKVALWAMVEHCRQLGFRIFDAQIMNPHLERMGAVTMSDRQYSKELATCLQERTSWSR